MLRNLKYAFFSMIGFLAGVCLAHAETGDGFTDRLNTERASRGLTAVTGDKSLVATAEANNAQQKNWGQGHHVVNGYAQCASVGPRTALDALVGCSGKIGYFASPSHAAILLHPDAARIAWAQCGNCNTVVIAMKWQAKPKAKRVITETLIIPPQTFQPGAPSATHDAVSQEDARTAPGCSGSCAAPRVEPHCKSIARCGLGRRRFHAFRRLFCK